MLSFLLIYQHAIAYTPKYWSIYADTGRISGHIFDEDERLCGLLV